MLGSLGRRFQRQLVDTGRGAGKFGEAFRMQFWRLEGVCDGWGGIQMDRKGKIGSDLVFSLEFIHEVVDKTVVEILTTKVSITGSGLDLKDALLDGQEGNIECTTTKIEDEDVALTLNLLVKAVGDGSSGGLVNDTENVEASDETGVLGSLTLRVVEVGGDSDNGVVDGATEVGLSGLAHLGEDHGGDLLRGESLLLALELDLDHGLASTVDDLEGEVLHVGLDLSIGELAADEALGVEDGVVGVHSDLVLGSISDQALGVGEGDERGRRPVTLVVGNDFATADPWLATECGVRTARWRGGDLPILTEDTDARVRRTKIDTDGGSHFD